MASGPITSRHIDKEIIETVTDFIFLGYQITSDGDCSHEIMTLAPWSKSYDHPRQHIKKQRHYFADRSISQSFLSAKELMLLNCGVGEDSWESLELQEDQTSQS